MGQRDSILPKAMLSFIATVVSLGWLGTVVAAIVDQENSYPLLVATGLFTTVIGAVFGLIGRKSQNRDNDVGGPGDDVP